jgi:hypothetical protein
VGERGGDEVAEFALLRYAAQGERVPLAGDLAQMGDEGAVGLELEIERREHAAHFGDVGIGTKKLQVPDAQRSQRGAARDHERRHRLKLAGGRSQRPDEERVADA